MAVTDLSVADDLAAVESGLDALELPTRPKRGTGLLTRAIPPLAAVGFLLLVWQSLVWAEVKPEYVLPSPGGVLTSLTDQWSQGNIVEAVWTSGHRGVLGFLASVAIATPLGLAIGRVKYLRLAFSPLLSGLQSLPSVAWVPAAIIWFGLTDAAIYAVVLLGAVPSIANGLISGLNQIPPLYLRVGNVLGATGLARVRHVLLPAALPGYVSGLKQGWAFSWRSLMAAELITYSPELGLGLGQLLDTGRQLSDMSLVFASILVILFVGIIVEMCLFAPLERWVLRRRGLLVTT